MNIKYIMNRLIHYERSHRRRRRRRRRQRHQPQYPEAGRRQQPRESGACTNGAGGRYVTQFVWYNHAHTSIYIQLKKYESRHTGSMKKFNSAQGCMHIHLSFLCHLYKRPTNDQQLPTHVMCSLLVMCTNGTRTNNFWIWNQAFVIICKNGKHIINKKHSYVAFLEDLYKLQWNYKLVDLRSVICLQVVHMTDKSHIQSFCNICLSNCLMQAHESYNPAEGLSKGGICRLASIMVVHDSHNPAEGHQ